MSPTRTLRVVDMHTAGEPVRIVINGYPRLEGNTILEKRQFAERHHDGLRRALMLEPRGHAGMYGVLPVEPSVPGAAAAVLFTHNSGYSTMCGHATIAIGRWLVESEAVSREATSARFLLEVPCGVVEIECTCEGDKVVDTAFLSVPAFVERIDYHIITDSFGEILVDIAYGGAFYAIVPASRLGLDLMRSPLERLTAAGTEITTRCRVGLELRCDNPDLAFLYGTILVDDAPPPQPSFNLCIFGEGQIDRSPTGSGVTARMALDHAAGRIAEGVPRSFRGVSGAPFIGSVARETAAGVIVRVSGQSYRSGETCFVLEEDDPFAEGFALPAILDDLGF